MKVRIEIEADNAAFEGLHGGDEVRRILKEGGKTLGAMLKDGHQVNLRDINGNKVGMIIVSDER